MTATGEVFEVVLRREQCVDAEQDALDCEVRETQTWQVTLHEHEG